MINFGLQDPNAFARGMQQGRQPFDEMTATIEKQRADNALRAYAANPQGPGAINALAQVDPRLAIQQQGVVAKQAEEKQQREAALIGALARDAKDAPGWDAAVDQAVAMGYPQAAQFKGRFTPQLRTAIMAAGGVKDEGEAAPTSMQRNYEFLNQQDPELAQRYLTNQASPLRFVTDGQGNVTVVDPGAFVGAGGAAVPNAAPGRGAGPPAVLTDDDWETGGQASAPGNFPESGNRPR